MPLLLLVLCSLLIPFVAKRLSSNNPVKWFVMMWIIQILFAAILGGGLLIFNYYGLLFILVGCTFLLGGYLTSTVLLGPKLQRQQLSCPTPVFREKRIKLLLCILFVLAFLNPVLYFYKNGFDVFVFFALEDLAEANHELSVERYSGDGGGGSVFDQILLTLTYLAPLVGGYCYSLVKKYWRVLCVACILPGIFVALTQAVKMALITSAIVWLGGYMTCCYRSRIKVRFNWKYALYLGLPFFGILFFSMILRTGKVDDEVAQLISHKFMNYAIGHLSAFDQWFMSDSPAEYTGGTKLFFGISNFIGLAKREQGLYSEAITVWKDGSFDTNVYTLFRILIDDFGRVGAWLALFFYGAATRMIMFLSRHLHFSLLGQTLLCGCWAFALWSFVTTFFAYTSYFVMLFLFYLTLYFLSKPASSCHVS